MTTGPTTGWKPGKEPAVEPLPGVAAATVGEAEGVAHVLWRPDADRLELAYAVVGAGSRAVGCDHGPGRHG